MRKKAHEGVKGVRSYTVDDPISYLNGTWQPLSQCVVPINTHALQYGTGCFEGIRGYWSGDQLNLLFLREHFERLAGSARLLQMESPSVEDMCHIAVEFCRKNNVNHNVYLRPMVFKKSTNLGPILVGEPDGYMCYGMALNDYPGPTRGLSVGVGSWQRLGDNMIPTRAVLPVAI